MIPSAFVSLDAIPLTPNGKVNRKNLPDPELVDRGARFATSTLELEIASHWAKLLGMDERTIKADVSFFELGGSSLKAIKACRMSHRTIAVADLYRHSTIESLAKFLQEKAAERHVLSRLNETQNQRALICVPYGGATPTVYHALAAELSESFQVYGVNLPGHELDEKLTDLQPIENVTQKIVDAISRLSHTEIFIYGHCGGTALAMDLALRLDSKEKRFQGLYVAASYPPARAEDLNSSIEKFLTYSDLELVEFFAKLGGFDDLGESELKRIGTVLKHDGFQAQKFFSNKLAKPPQKLSKPLTVIIGTEDPLTADFKEGYRNWEVFSDQVTLKTVRGGHYFIGESPKELAEILENSSSI